MNKVRRVRYGRKQTNGLPVAELRGLISSMQSGESSVVAGMHKDKPTRRPRRRKAMREERFARVWGKEHWDLWDLDDCN